MNFSDYEKLISLLKELEPVDKNLQSLINEYIASREKSILQVKAIYTDIESINIGNYLTLYPKENIIKGINVFIDLNNKAVDLKCTYNSLTNNTIILKKDLDQYIAKLKERYLPINEQKILSLVYNKDFESFQGTEVPSIKWFKNNYLTIESEMHFKDLKSDTDIEDENSLINYKTFLELSAVNEQYIKIKNTNSLVTNFFDINMANLKIKNNEIELSIINTDSVSLEEYNDVVTNYNIQTNLILKDLTNVKRLIVKTDKENNLSLITKEDIIYYTNGITNNTLQVEPYIVNNKAIKPLEGKYLDKILKAINESNSFYEAYNLLRLENNPIISIDLPSLDKSNNVFYFQDEEIVRLASISGIIYLLTGMVPVSLFRMKELKDFNVALLDSQEYYKGLPADLTMINLLVSLFNEIKGHIFKDNSYILDTSNLISKENFKLGLVTFENTEDYVNLKNLSTNIL